MNKQDTEEVIKYLNNNVKICFDYVHYAMQNLAMKAGKDIRNDKKSIELLQIANLADSLGMHWSDTIKQLKDRSDEQPQD